MLENNLLYHDNYIYFSFGDTHSSEYNLYIKNDIDDLKIYLNNEGSIEYASPKYQNNKYVLGVTHPQRVIPLTLVADGLTRSESLRLFKWLKMGTIGQLSFDFAKDWVYDTIISKVTDPNMYAKDEDHFIVVFDIEWSTLNGTAAHSAYAATAYYGSDSSNSSARYNHSDLLIPSYSLATLSSSDTGYQAMITLFYLGDKSIEINISHEYYADMESDKNLSLQLAIETDTNNFNEFSSSFKATVNPIAKGDHIIEYSQQSNLYFADNFLLEQQKARSHLTSLETQYSSEPLFLKSPGAPRLITKKEDLQIFADTAYRWKLIKPAIAEKNPYANTADIYPLSITEESEIIEKDNVDWNGDYSGYYFIYYDVLNIIDKSVNEDSNDKKELASFLGTVRVVQYTEAI